MTGAGGAAGRDTDVCEVLSKETEQDHKQCIPASRALAPALGCTLSGRHKNARHRGAPTWGIGVAGAPEGLAVGQQPRLVFFVEMVTAGGGPSAAGSPSLSHTTLG